MEDNQHFEELVTQTEAAKQLHIGVATLKKYSLIIEDVTNDRQYYARTKRNSRLYSKKNIEELKTLKTLSQKNKLTLQEAAEQMFLISDKAENEEVQTKNLVENDTLVDAKQVVNLLNMLQQTIVTQNKAIQDLQAQVAQIEKQNQQLIDNAHQLSAPTIENGDKQISTDELDKEIDSTSQQDDQEKVDNENKDTHEEILRKARENQQKSAQKNVHRTLAEMQLHPKKQQKHWWQKLFK